MNDAIREPTFLILAALAPGPLHGYGLIKEVGVLSEGRLSLRPGTLYGALDRLGDEGLVEPDHQEVVDGRLRRYYRLTDAGAQVLAQEAVRLRRNAESAERRLAARSRPAGAAGGVARPAGAAHAGGMRRRPGAFGLAGMGGRA